MAEIVSINRCLYLSRVKVTGFRAISHNTVELKLKPLTILFGPNASGKTSIIEAIFLTLKKAFNVPSKITSPIRTLDETARINVDTGKSYISLYAYNSKTNEETELAHLVIHSEGTYATLGITRVIEKEIEKDLHSFVHGEEIKHLLTERIARRHLDPELRQKLLDTVDTVVKKLRLYRPIIDLNLRIEPDRDKPFRYVISIKPRIDEEYIYHTLLTMLPLSTTLDRSFLAETFKDIIVDIIRRRIQEKAKEMHIERLSDLLPTIWVPAWRDVPRPLVDVQELALEMLPPARILTAVDITRELHYLRMRLGSKILEDEVRKLGGELLDTSYITAPRPTLVTEGEETERVVKLSLEAETITGKTYPEEVAADGERSLHTLLYALTIGMKYGGTLLIEEPELHLHPKLQHKIAHMICKAVERGVQIIVSTHSDHFIAGIIEAIAADEIKPDKVRAYYIHRENGKVVATEVDLSPNKLVEYSHILSDFVEEDLAAYTKLLKRLQE